MDVVRYTQAVPLLRRPVLIAAFQGWNDAGECASAALEALGVELEAAPFAEIDGEEFFDFQVARPTIHRGPDGTRMLDWPENRLRWASLPGTDRDVVLLNGTEPNLRWRGFSRAVLEIADRLGVELVVTVGALQVDVPHTRPTPLTGSATDPALLDRVGVATSDYEGPTGITGVLHHAVADAGLAGLSLWAGVPHYLAGASFAAGTLALAEAIVGLFDADVSLDELARDAITQREEIGELVADDEELATYVSELEERIDAATDALGSSDPSELPDSSVSGDELAAELERYLRDRDR